MYYIGLLITSEIHTEWTSHPDHMYMHGHEAYSM